MEYAPTAGEKCRVAIPVHPDAIQNEGGKGVRETAADALERVCSEHGFTPTDVHQVWSGTVQAARTTEHANTVAELPNSADHLILFVYEATAA